MANSSRWLVHSLASYYGLRTWSVTVGNPPRREAYVGINLPRPSKQTGAKPSNAVSAAATSDRGPKAKPGGALPRPIWVSV